MTKGETFVNLIDNYIEARSKRHELDGKGHKYKTYEIYDKAVKFHKDMLIYYINNKKEKQ